MKRIKFLARLLAIICIQSNIIFAQQIIIPAPVELKQHKGHFHLKDNTSIICEEESFSAEAAMLANSLKLPFFSKDKALKGNHIRIRKEAKKRSDEYELIINHKEILIIAGSNQAIYYGTQSLIQLYASSLEGKIPCLKIRDFSSFSWRGMHLDVCRHFFSKEEVKKYIDLLALYKMNIFHWHLTEDQGWRIAIEKYPKLTETGAWRSGSMIGKYSDQRFDSLRYGGFYSRDDIKEVVEYAQKRHVSIVPEIEMPGHALAALASYPAFSCSGGPFEVGKAWGVYDDVYCAGNDSTFYFLQDILDEVIQLFPGEYIHIGGDECPKTRWKTCGKCQARMKTEGLKDEHELQSYFIRRIEKYLNSKGKKIIGWDEILEGGLAPNAAVMSWRGREGGIEAAKQKHDVVMSPGKPCYFDHYQHADKEKEPLAIGGLNTLEMVYKFTPTPEGLTPEEKKYVMGAQGNVWSEYMKDFRQVEYMAIPRMQALAEALWSPAEKKDYADFRNRLRLHLPMLDQKGVNYCRHFLNEP
jgi:hexosaminidase